VSLNEYNVKSDLAEKFSVKTIVTQGSCRIFAKAIMLLRVYKKSYHVYVNLMSKFQLLSLETSEVKAPFILQRPYLTSWLTVSLPTLLTNIFDKLNITSILQHISL